MIYVTNYFKELTDVWLITVSIVGVATRFEDEEIYMSFAFSKGRKEP